MARPSDYLPEYCQMLLEHMSEGFSYETFAAKIDTCRQTLYNWEKEYPEFLDTKRIAIEKCQLWWEKRGMDLYSSKEGPNLQASLWMFQMKARFRWKDQDPKGDEQDKNRPLTLEDKRKLLDRAEKELSLLKEELKEITIKPHKDE